MNSHGSEALKSDVGQGAERKESGAHSEPLPHYWIATLLRRWKWLLVGAAVAPALGAATVLTAPRPYVAEALVAPSRSRTQVQFEPQIKTVDASATDASNSATAAQSHQALIDLIRSSDIEQSVIGQLHGVFPENQLTTGELSARIAGSQRPRSDIIAIDASADTPTAATSLANAWAKTYVDFVNNLYSVSQGGQSIANLRDKAQSDLRQAQDALTASLKDSRLEDLDREIVDKGRDLATLSTPYQTITTNFQQQGSPTSFQQQSNATTQNQANSGTSSSSTGIASGSATGALNDYRLLQRRTLDDLAQTLRRLDTTRENVLPLLNMVEASGGNASDSAALAVMKTQLISLSEALPAQLQIQVPANSDAITADYLHQVVSSIDKAREHVNQEFQTRREVYEADRAAQTARLQTELRDLRSQREGADAERKRLTSARDLALDTYNALARKTEENRVAASTAGQEVQLASTASVATQAPRPTITLLSLSALGGLALAGVIVLVATAFEGAHARDRRAAASLLSRDSAIDERHLREKASNA